MTIFKNLVKHKKTWMDKRESEILEQMLSEKLEIQKEKPIFNDFCSSLYNMAASHFQYRNTD